MNFTKRYFKLRDDIVQAINDSAMPPLAAEQCLRELRAELLTVVERELREGENAEANVQTEQSVQPFPSSGASRHLPPEGKARGAEGEPSQSPAATASPRGEADGRTGSSAPTEAGKEG